MRGMLRFGLHEAIAVTSSDLGQPHAAAMGVRAVGDGLALYPYVTTRTYKNLKTGSPVSLAFTHDSLTFCDVVLNPQKLRFRSGRNEGVYVIDADVDVYVEAMPREVVDGSPRATVLLRVLDVYPGRGGYFPYSRANSMLIELLVYFTKIRALSAAGDPRRGEVLELLKPLNYAASLVRRLGSGELVRCVDRVYEELRSLGISP